MIEVDILLRRHGGKRLPISVPASKPELDGCWNVVRSYLGYAQIDKLMQGLAATEEAFNEMTQAKAAPDPGRVDTAYANGLSDSFRSYCRLQQLPYHISTALVLGKANRLFIHMRPQGKTGRITFVITQEQP